MTNLDSILKTRDISLPTKVYIVKAMVFSSSHVWMWDLDHKEGWALKKNWCFWTLVLEKTLESPLNSKEVKPVNPKGINPEYLLEGLMLKLQHFDYLLQSVDSLEKTLMLGKIEDKRRRGRQRMRWLDSITDSMDVRDREAWHAAVHGVAKSWTWLSNWNTIAKKTRKQELFFANFTG